MAKNLESRVERLENRVKPTKKLTLAELILKLHRGEAIDFSGYTNGERMLRLIEEAVEKDGEEEQGTQTEE